jgi:uncharacterized protein YndB with AHSA1/START domain
MRTLFAAAALLIATPAAAEVVKSSEHGFELRHSHVISAPPEEATRGFANVARWWDDEHTYSGSPSNLSMELKPGGCFCERLPGGGGIEHMRVTYVDPGKRILLTGSLGPLLYEATSGVMDVQFKPAGAGSQVTVNYKVAGFANGGAAKMAPLVDGVLGSLIARFAAYTTPPISAR